MTRVILYIASSLDGFIAGKDDDISWLDKYNEAEGDYDEFFSGIGAIIEGRRTYDVEKRLGGDRVHQVPTFVLSNNAQRKESDQPYVMFTDKDIGEVLKEAKGLTKKDIWILGGGKVIKQFLDRGLIDEIRLTVIPILLGDGIKLFNKFSKEVLLSFVDVKEFGKGMIELTYKIAKTP